MLDTKYHIYEHIDGGQIVRTVEFSLPHTLHAAIDVITPTNYFGPPPSARSAVRWRKRRSLDRATEETKRTPDTSGVLGLGAVCNQSAITTQCLRSLYNTFDYTPRSRQGGSGAAITAFLDETANISDFRQFMREQRPDAASSYNFGYTIIDDALNHQELETEFYDGRDGEAGLGESILIKIDLSRLTDP